MSSSFDLLIPISLNVFKDSMLKNGITVSEISTPCDKSKQASFTVNDGDNYIHCYLDLNKNHVIELTRYGMNNADFLIEVLKKDFDLKDIDDIL